MVWDEIVDERSNRVLEQIPLHPVAIANDLSES